MLKMIDGLLMALADSVPGVSGGTVAFLLGFYDQMIGSLKQIVSKDAESRRGALRFLIPLGFGWAIGMVLAMLLLDGLIESNIYLVSSVFLGFVLASIPAVAWKERRRLAKSLKASPMMLVGFLLVYLITRFSINKSVELSISKMTLANGLILFIAAAAAASAMVLPGISGSSLLMAFGLYLPVVSQVSALVHGQWLALPVVFVFGLGALTGLCGFVRLLNRALRRYRAQTIFAVLGMMIASLYAVAAGPLTLKQPSPMLSRANFRLEYFALGCLMIALLTVFEKIAISKKLSTKG